MCGRVLRTLRGAEPIRAGRKAVPSVVVIDLQSVKTTLKGGNVCVLYRVLYFIQRKDEVRWKIRLPTEFGQS